MSDGKDHLTTVSSIGSGSDYIRCKTCGREAVNVDELNHRDGCPDAPDDDNGREEPTRSEPADFGHGESTGVQDL